jgi:Protein of unknown function (DUF4089)
MNEAQTLAYVQAAAVAVDLPLTDEQAQRVATHLQRTAALAALLDSYELAPHDEPAEIYCPAPFQASPH